jgi:acyl transferase domain-containing protein
LGGESSELSGELSELAARYLAGQDVDWRASWAGGGCDRIPLPGYEFDHLRYWFTDVDTVYGDGAEPDGAEPDGAEPDGAEPDGAEPDGAEHPIRFQSVAGGDATTAARTTLTGQEFYLRDHLVNGRKVLPGVAYPELARRAASCAGLPVGQVRDLRWLRLLEVNGSPVHVTVHFRHEGGGHAFEVRSDSGAADVVHARGVLLPPTAGAGADPAGQVDLRAVAASCPRTVPVADYYEKIRALGLVHGPALASIQDIRVGNGVLLARLRLPAVAGPEPAAFDLHLSLLDGALQTLGALDGPPEHLLLPLSVAAVTHSGVLPPECFAYVTTVPAQPGDAARAFDIQLLNDDGRELASLHHLTITRATSHEPAAGQPHVALHALLHRLRAGEISEAEAELAMEASFAN